MKTLLITLLLFTISAAADTADQTSQRALEEAGAPIFHSCGEDGQLVVTGKVNGEHIVLTGDHLHDLQGALNFDPVVRKAILDGMARAKDKRETEEAGKK